MDRIVNSLQNNRLVFWEEIARDGAQAKTLLTATQRIEIARAFGNFFNENGPDHLIFAAGFVSIAKEEVDIIKKFADEVDNCYLAVNCRSNKNEISNCIDSIKKAKFGRVAFILPVCKRLSELMLHKSQKQVLNYGLDIAKYALDKSNGLPIDIQLAGAFNADPIFVAEIANKMNKLGIATVGLGDTRGKMYPNEATEYLKIIKKHSAKDISFSTHFHNDIGFALSNNIEAIKQGFLLPATSLLGLGERNGLARTELLSFLMAYQPEKLKKRLGIDGENLFLSKPNLKMLPEIAKLVSKHIGIPLNITDPIVGTGVNSISTGTPFVDTISFQPFDTEKVLGIPKKIFITHLASKRIIKEYIKIKNIELSDKQISEILEIIKHRAYKLGRAIFPDEEIMEIIYESKK